MTSSSNGATLQDEASILRFWENEAAPSAPHSPAKALEGWVELIQLAATDMLRREEELVRRLAEANAFSRREASRAIRGALGGLTRHALLAQWEDEGLHLFDIGAAREGRASIWPSRTAVFAGGAIPQPGLQSLVGALMVSRRVLCRPSRWDPFLIPEFVETLARIQARSAKTAVGAIQIPPVRDTVVCATWDHEKSDLTRRIVQSADSLVVYGDASTVDELMSMRHPGADGFVYGPRTSFAVLDELNALSDTVVERAMDDFAEDVVAFDQRGCLSPQVLYILSTKESSVTRAAEALAKALMRRAKEDGFAPGLPPAAAAEIQGLRAAYSMDPGGRRKMLASDSIPGWTILVDMDDVEFSPLPGYQTLRIARLPSWKALIPRLEPWRGQLQCMGIGPDTACIPEGIGEALEELGLSRACPLGRMQDPPLQWTHDENPFFPVRIPV